VSSRMPSHSSTGPTAIEVKAARDLTYIRATMERASEFTAVPGWGGIGMGVVAFAAAFVSGLGTGSEWWVLCWLTAAPVAAVVGVVAMLRKARRLNVSLTDPAGRRFSLGLTPPLVAGAALTVGIWSAGEVALLPGTWLLLYGTSVLTGGMNSVPLVPIVGACFMGLGLIAINVPLSIALGLLTLGFGGLHVVFGWIIVRRYGG